MRSIAFTTVYFLFIIIFLVVCEVTFLAFFSLRRVPATNGTSVSLVRLI